MTNINRYILGLTAVLTWFAAMPAAGQGRGAQNGHSAGRPVAGIYANYLDSLSLLHRRVDSLRVKSSTTGGGGLRAATSVLFTPLTFYHRPAARLFSLDSTSTGQSTANQLIDGALMNIYLKRPDLVKTGESDLDIVNIIPADKAERPVRVEPKIVDDIVVQPMQTDVVPVDVLVKKPNFWTILGDYNLQFMQNYVSGNWYKGGESNYSMLGYVVMQANYNNKQKVKWDNKLEVKLGLQTSRGDSIHSYRMTEDLLRYTTKLGLQATRRWYYTVQVIAQTQSLRTYKTNDQRIYASFMAPFSLNLSVGMDYNVELFRKRLTGSVHLAPMAMNWKYVRRPELATRYGIDDGKRQLTDYGSELTVDLSWKFCDNINWKTRFYGYTTYKRAELEWENTFVFRFNRYIAANIFLYPRFDDGAKYDDRHGYFQLKEYLSLGFSYSF